MKISRRDFLKGSAAAAAAAAAVNVLPVMAEEEAAAEEPKYSFEIAPDPVDESEIVETKEANIIVVGAGVSGLCCACRATELGESVILFAAGSKHVERGGSNHGIDTVTQAAEGISYKKEDLAKRIKQEYMANGYNIDQAKWSKWLNNNTETMNWLINKMESYGATTTLEDGYTDGDGLWDFAPASHNFTYVGDDFSVFKSVADYGGCTFGAFLGQGMVNDVYEYEIQQNGGEIIYNTVAQYLEKDETGRVVSVIALNADGEYVRFVGKKGIVLATGDFSQNHEMMQKYAPQAMDLLNDMPVNYDACFQFGGLFPGDGQKMGLWAGAAWQRTYPNAAMVDNLTGPYGKEISNVTTINLNKAGKRFMNEDCLCSYSAWALKQQKDMTCYYVWDAAYANHYESWHTFGATLHGDGGVNGPAGTSPEDELAGWDSYAESGVYIKADTLEELLAQWDDIDQEQALATIEKYNEYCDNGYDEDFQKCAAELAPIKEGPFYGYKFTLNASSNFLCITGGLRTSVDMEVCDENDNPIPGLYNVGIMVGDSYAGCYNFAICGHNLSMNCNTMPYMLAEKLAAEEA